MNVLKDNPRSIFFQYALPSVLGMLAISSASIVDGFFVGNYVGASGLAAINISLPIFSLLFGLSLMLAVGGSVVSGKLMAQGDTKSASIIFTKTLITITIFAFIVCSIIFFNLETILNLFGANSELIEIAAEYLFVMLLFIPFLMIGIVLDYFVKVDNRPLLAFVALLGSAVLNIILDWLLIVYLDRGIFGAALATGVSHLLLIIVLLPHFFSKKATLKFVKPLGSWMQIVKSALNGASEFVNETSVGITTMIFNYIMITTLGVEGIAAFTIINYILWIGIMISFGISDSLQPIISKNYGAKEPKRIMIFLKLALLSVAFVGLSMISLMLLAPNELTNLFLDNSDDETRKIVISFALFIWPVFLFNGFNMTLSAYLTAIHKPLPSATIALTRSLVFPITFILLLPLIFGINGIFMALAVAEFFTFILALYFFKRFAPNRLDAID